jgi:hypothetical protein
MISFIFFGKLTSDLTFPCSVGKVEMIRTKLNYATKFQGRPQIPMLLKSNLSVSGIMYVEIHTYRTSIAHKLQEICAKNTYKLKLETCYLVQHCAVQ